MKCHHLNFVSIFNSERGCAYCPDCGKSPLSAYDCGIAILAPGFDKCAESIAKELLSTCPDPACDECKELRSKYPYLK